MEPSLRVGIIGCGLIGRKRAQSLGSDTAVGFFDKNSAAADTLANEFGSRAFRTLDELLSCELDVAIIATVHSALSDLACHALRAGCHVLVEKPAGIGVSEIDSILSASSEGDRLVKVGFNHRFHPGLAHAIAAAQSGEFGEILHLRAHYGHGGRLGYEKEWRADPAQSGGGEIVDQGMHLLDLSCWLLGELPLHSSLLRTQFWDAPVDDNAILILGERDARAGAYALLDVSWTEWKNGFFFEITCERAKLLVEGLTRSYGSQTFTMYRMKPELGPPDVEVIRYGDDDPSWALEWQHFRSAVLAGKGPLLGDLNSARYAWSCVEQAQAAR